MIDHANNSPPGPPPEPPPALPPETAATVRADTPCFTCGYNLRGLRHNATCPECGADIAPSLRGDGLHNRSPAWIGVSSCGAAFISLNAILAGVMWFARLALPDAGQTFRLADGPWRDVDALSRFVSGASGLLVLATGVYWLTRREPFAPAYRGRWINAATLTRAALFIWIAVTLWLLVSLLGYGTTSLRASATATERSMAVRFAAAEFARCGLMICITIVGLRLARRMRRDDIVVSGWCLLMVLIAGAAASTVNAIAATASTSRPGIGTAPFQLNGIARGIALAEIIITIAYWWCLDSALGHMRAQAKLTTDDAGEPLRLIKGSAAIPTATSNTEESLQWLAADAEEPTYEGDRPASTQ